MANFNLNKVILGGRLTSEPELRQTANGIPVTSFTVAVNRRFVSKSTDAQQPAQTADFINVIAWRNSAEFVSRYFHKGSSICVVGSIQTRTWTDQQGTKRYATEVVADEINFVDSKSDGSGSSQESSYSRYTPDNQSSSSFASTGSDYSGNDAQTEPKFSEISNDDDLPF